MALVSPEEIRYQEANVNADASGGLYASSITMMVVTTTAVTLRLLCKRKLSAKVTLDDYCIMVALVRPHVPLGAIDRRDSWLIITRSLYMASASN